MPAHLNFALRQGLQLLGLRFGADGLFGGSASLIHQASVTLDNDQTSHLPTTAITLTGNPGANRMLVVLSSEWLLDARGGAYSGFDEFLAFLSYGGSSLYVATRSYKESSQGAFADNSAVHVLGTFRAFDSGADGATWLADTTNVADMGLTVFAVNGSSGNLGGGHVSNSLLVPASFFVKDLTTGLYLTTAESGWNETTRTFS